MYLIMLLYKFACVHWEKKKVSMLHVQTRVSMSSDNRNLKVPSSDDILDLDQSPNLTPSSAHFLRILDVRHNVDKVGRR